jgi:Family of unknown function (DUF6412)
MRTARTAVALSVLAFLVLGSGLVVGAAADDPAVLLALLGTALCALGCVAGARIAVSTAPAVVVPGRRERRASSAAARQHHPDAAGRPRPRAPGPVLAAT